MYRVPDVITEAASAIFLHAPIGKTLLVIPVAQVNAMLTRCSVLTLCVRGFVVTLFRMSHPASWPSDRLLAECTVERTRRSGPGGQHRNKVETAVVITHTPTGIRAEASERRSQAVNLAKAIFRLRVKLALTIRGEAAAEPSELWKDRMIAGRISVNPEHDDFPAMLAEALDVLAAHGWSPAESGAVLGVSSSQLVKFVKLEANAFILINAKRRGLRLGTLQ
jgi:hypothetical protein